MFKNLILVFAISLFCLGCPGGDGGSSSDVNVEPRDFYIENHKVYALFMPCWSLDQPMAEHQEELVEGRPSEDVEILRPGQKYLLEVEFYNDQDNTRWIAFEVFVDGKRTSSSGEDFTITKHKSNTARIMLFDRLPYNYVGRSVTIDVWLEDTNGVTSEVYTIDVKVERQIWYPPAE